MTNKPDQPIDSMWDLDEDEVEHCKATEAALRHATERLRSGQQRVVQLTAALREAQGELAAEDAAAVVLWRGFMRLRCKRRGVALDSVVAGPLKRDGNVLTVRLRQAPAPAPNPPAPALAPEPVPAEVTA